MLRPRVPSALVHILVWAGLPPTSLLLAVSGQISFFPHLVPPLGSFVRRPIRQCVPPRTAAGRQLAPPPLVYVDLLYIVVNPNTSDDLSPVHISCEVQQALQQAGARPSTLPRWRPRVAAWARRGLLLGHRSTNRIGIVPRPIFRSPSLGGTVGLLAFSGRSLRPAAIRDPQTPRAAG